MFTFTQQLDRSSTGFVLGALTKMTRELVGGEDPTLRALSDEARGLGVRPIIVGGVAVIHHGYRRTTEDRDVMLTHHDAEKLAEHLEEHLDWERLEIRQYAFLHKPTGVIVDFLVSGHLMQMGRPYFFPDVRRMESAGSIADLPVIGLHELIWLKLVAGRMQDLADIMELCKRHLNDIDIERVLKPVLPEDDDLRVNLAEIVRRAPLELAGERRLGQDHPDS
ncbi:MAG: nucleotidyl transferase AbiEii/AbiGii toxin family protein [Pirellulales bacterium]